MTRHARLERRALTIGAVLVWTSLVPAQQPPRDLSRGTTGDTGSLSGVIVSDDRGSQPLRRALVTLSGPASRTVITNTDGRFSFESLPAGRFTLSGAKDGYVAASYGAVRPGRPGRAIVLDRGESRAVVVRLPRAAAISGTVVDPDGQPAAGIVVTALVEQWSQELGARQLVPVRATPASTDDRGVYRIFGLAAGEYRIAAQVSMAWQSSIQMISDGEIGGALEEARDSRARARSADAFGAAAFEENRAVLLAPVYFPGTPAVASALPVRIAAGEERMGIDIQLQYVPATTIRVTAATAANSAEAPSVTLRGPAENGVTLVRGATVDRDGRATFTHLGPGQYAIAARFPVADWKAESETGGANGGWFWSFDEVTISSQGLVDVLIPPRPLIAVTGRVVFESAAPVGAAATAPGLTLPASHVNAVESVTTGLLPAIEIEDAGRFAMKGIIPGAYRLRDAVPGSRSPIDGWWLKSIVVGAADILDAPLAFHQGSTDGVITFSDRASEVGGTVSDVAGMPGLDWTVVIFSTNPSAWFVNSRRVAAIRVEAGGRYLVRNLPSGDYWIATADDLEPGEWFDAAVLQELTRTAIRIRLGEHEKKTQDLVAPAR